MNFTMVDFVFMSLFLFVGLTFGWFIKTFNIFKIFIGLLLLSVPLTIVMESVKASVIHNMQIILPFVIGVGIQINFRKFHLQAKDEDSNK
jgi:hypothetical protein